MVELPKNEAELQALLDAKEQETAEKWKAKHDGEMASMRKKHDEELKKAKEQANMTAEELAEQKYKEQQEAKDKELDDLRNFKKTTVLGGKLEKEGLPSYFKNDVRLLNAEEGDYDKVIKDIKKEYEADRPKGATHSTVVQNAQGSKGGQPQDNKQAAFDAFGEALKEVVQK